MVEWKDTPNIMEQDANDMLGLPVETYLDDYYLDSNHKYFYLL